MLSLLRRADKDLSLPLEARVGTGQQGQLSGLRFQRAGFAERHRELRTPLVVEARYRQPFGPHNFCFQDIIAGALVGAVTGAVAGAGSGAALGGSGGSLARHSAPELRAEESCKLKS